LGEKPGEITLFVPPISEIFLVIRASSPERLWQGYVLRDCGDEESRTSLLLLALALGRQGEWFCESV